MRTKQALKNTITSILLQIVAVIPGIIIPRMFTELYGSAVNGLATSIGQFITYIGLVEAGIGAAGTVALYRPLADGDVPGINGVISAARSFYLRSGMIFVAFIGALILFYPYAVQSEITDLGFIRLMIVVLSLNGVVDYFFLGKYRVLLLADQRGYIISLAQIVGTLVMMVASILLMQWGASAVAVKFVTAAVYILRGVAVALYVKKKYPHLSFRAKPNMGALNQRWDALLHQVVGMIVNNTDIVLLTLLLSQGALVEVSVYGVYNMVTYSLSNVMNAFTNGLGAGFGQVISKGEDEVLRKSYSSYEYIFFLVVFVVFTCMGVLVHPFVGLYSARFADSQVYVRWSLVALFTLAGLVQSLRLPGITVICAAGHYTQTRTRAIIEAVINLGVSLALIRPLGIVGVLLGTCLSYLYRTTDVILYTAKNFVSGTLKKTVARLIRNGVVSALLVVGGLWLVPQSPDSWMVWVLSSLAYAAVSGLVLLGVNVMFEKTEFTDFMNRLKETLLRRQGEKA